MRLLTALLVCLFCVTSSSLIHATASYDDKPAEFNGMRITPFAPWTLITTDTAGVKLKQGLGFMLTPHGAGWATVYPAKHGLPLPTPEKLKNMNANELSILIRDFSEIYEGFLSSSGEEESSIPFLAELNGFTAIVTRWNEKPVGAQEPGYAIHTFSYYFILKNRLVCLNASVYGDEAAGSLLERICVSFIPDINFSESLPGRLHTHQQ